MILIFIVKQTFQKIILLYLNSHTKVILCHVPLLVSHKESNQKILRETIFNLLVHKTNLWLDYKIMN